MEGNKKILSNLVYSNFFLNNKKYIDWFEKHKNELLNNINILQTYYEKNLITIELTGSRSVNLAHPDSDLDIVIVVHDVKNLHIYNSIDEQIHFLNNIFLYYEENEFSDELTIEKTNENQVVLIAKNPNIEYSDNIHLTIIKIFIKTNEKYKVLQSKYLQADEEWDVEKKFFYINEMWCDYMMANSTSLSNIEKEKFKKRMMERKKWVNMLK